VWNLMKPGDNSTLYVVVSSQWVGGVANSGKLINTSNNVPVHRQQWSFAISSDEEWPWHRHLCTLWTGPWWFKIELVLLYCCFVYWLLETLSSAATVVC
jgi:hypothetical protein